MSAGEPEPAEVALARSVQADLKREFAAVYGSIPQSDMDENQRELERFLKRLEEGDLW